MSHLKQSIPIEGIVLKTNKKSSNRTSLKGLLNTSGSEFPNTTKDVATREETKIEISALPMTSHNKVQSERVISGILLR